MVGLQECQPLAVENDSTSSLLSLGPKSAPKFPGVCYDGAAGDGVLCRFQKIIPVWCFFFWILEGFNQVFFSSIAPRDTTRWHKHYANMMGEKERLTRNLMQFVCIFFVSLWGIHSSDFPGFYDGFIPIHPVHQDIAAQGLPRHLGLVEKRPNKSLSEFWPACRKVWQGKNKVKVLFFTPDFYVTPWLSWNSLNFFGSLSFRGRSWFWLKCLCEMMLEDDVFFWWNVGKLLQVNETTSLTLECRAFTVRI